MTLCSPKEPELVAVEKFVLCVYIYIFFVCMFFKKAWLLDFDGAQVIMLSDN